MGPDGGSVCDNDHLAAEAATHSQICVRESPLQLRDACRCLTLPHTATTCCAAASSWSGVYRRGARCRLLYNYKSCRVL